MDVVEALEDLLHHLLDLRQRELHIDIAQQASKVVLAEVEDQVEGCFVPVVGPADLNQIDYVFVVELLKNANLPENNCVSQICFFWQVKIPEGSDREPFLLVLHQDSLQRYNLLWVRSTPCLKHLTESTLGDTF